MDEEITTRGVRRSAETLDTSKSVFAEIFNKLGLPEKITRKLKILEKTPRLMFQELLFRVGLKEDPDREVIAFHEGGHALIAFLIQESSVLDIYLRGIHSETQAALVGLMGTDIEPGNVEIDGLMDEADLINVYLAGLAATSTRPEYSSSQYHSSADQINSRLESGKDDDWNDISEPCKLIAQEWEATHSKQPTREELKSAYFDWLNKLTVLLGSPKFQTALRAVQNVALAKAEKSGKAHERIKAALFENGISENDLAQMRSLVKEIKF